MGLRTNTAKVVVVVLGAEASSMQEQLAAEPGRPQQSFEHMLLSTLEDAPIGASSLGQ